MNLTCGAVIRNVPFIPLTEIQKERWRNWISALRSGNYKQAKHHLRVLDTYCCMGVACDIIDPEGWVKYEKGFGFSLKNEKGEIMSTNEYILPQIRRIYGGMGPLGPYVDGFFPDGEKLIEAKKFSLTALNDLGATFDEIADILDKAMTEGYTCKVRLLESVH